jgi:cob(I)alamin adenosyltransferase
MAKIYTKTGDKGKTALVGGTRVSKGDIRIEAYGTVDELNSWIGLLSDITDSEERKLFLRFIQNHLFNIGSHLATESGNTKSFLPKLSDLPILRLEEEIDKMQADLMPLKHFILPGGHPIVSQIHIARTVCRRTERCVVRLNEQEDVSHLIVELLNRLSDYLFVLARMAAKELEIQEHKWEY